MINQEGFISLVINSEGSVIRYLTALPWSSMIETWQEGRRFQTLGPTYRMQKKKKKKEDEEKEEEEDEERRKRKRRGGNISRFASLNLTPLSRRKMKIYPSIFPPIQSYRLRVKVRGVMEGRLIL